MELTGKINKCTPVGDSSTNPQLLIGQGNNNKNYQAFKSLL